ncbi:MAG: TRAP transporter substrate-binding protein, partial [Xanthobacteraceae bacterium]
MLLRTLLTSVAIAALCGSAFAQDKTFNLRLSHWVPATHPLQKAMEEWGASVEKASGGTIKSQVFPAQQLGKAFDHYDMTRDGIVDLSYINPGQMPGRFPIIAAGEIPFVVREAHGATRAIDQWYKKYAANEMKDVKYCFSFTYDPARIHMKNKRVEVPADIKGLKFRPSHGTFANWVAGLGATNVQAGPAETRDLLEKGVVDAVTSPYGSMYIFGMEKVTKYTLELPVTTSTFQWIMNWKTYNAMSDSQKKVIDDHCTTDMASKFAGPWIDFEAGAVGKLRSEPGREMYTITDAQTEEWKKSVEPVYKQWADDVRKVGGDADAIMKELRTALS